MKEKKYPILDEEENVGMSCEPIVDYQASNSGFNGTAIEAEPNDDPMIPDDYDSGIGPYSLEELNARIDEAETFIEKAERGDWSDWVTEDQSRANLYSKYLWLR